MGWDDGREGLDRIIEHNHHCAKNAVIYEHEEWHSLDGEFFSTVDDDLNIVEYHPDGDVILGNMRDEVDENDD